MRQYGLERSALAVVLLTRYSRWQYITNHTVVL
jgi:hypothetical protein